MSTDIDDPGHALWLKNVAKGVTVLLYGVEQKAVFTADEEQGLIVQADLDDRGLMQVEEGGQRVRTITRRGFVEIKVGR
jgi:hypothetical protein